MCDSLCIKFCVISLCIKFCVISLCIEFCVIHCVLRSVWFHSILSSVWFHSVLSNVWFTVYCILCDFTVYWVLCDSLCTVFCVISLCIYSCLCRTYEEGGGGPTAPDPPGWAPLLVSAQLPQTEPLLPGKETKGKLQGQCNITYQNNQSREVTLYIQKIISWGK